MRQVYFAVAVIVIIIIVVIAYLASRRRSSRGKDESRRNSESMEARSVTATASQDGTFRARYRVEKGIRQDMPQQNQAPSPHQVQAAPQQPQHIHRPQATAEHEFPRNVAHASRRQFQDMMEQNAQGQNIQNERVQVKAAPLPVEQQARIRNQVLQTQNSTVASNSTPAPRPQQNLSVQVPAGIETIYVRNLAEAFSPKEDIEAEFGVNEDELQSMVEAYKKRTEPKERKLPINKHFNMDSYNNSKNTIRQSAMNMRGNTGEKRGQITKNIYKTYGKNFIKQPNRQQQGDVMAAVVTSEQHKQNMVDQKRRNNPGSLTVRT